MVVRPPMRLKKSSKKCLNCSQLGKAEVRNEFRHSLAEKLAKVQTSLCSEDSMDQKWTSISSSLCEAAAQTISHKGKKHQDWFDDNSDAIKSLLENMHNAHRATLNNPTSSSIRRQWQKARREVQKTLQSLQNEWWTTKAHEIQYYADRNYMHNFYNSIKNIYGPKSCSVTPLKSADSLILLKDQNQILLRWAEHFDDLLNQRPSADLTLMEIA